MSSEALAWAFKVNLKPSALKFTLVALCECANYRTGHIHPSIAHLEEITGQDRKTIIANIAKLEQLGLLADTGERAGRTGQIKVYQVVTETVPKTEQFQKRNSSVSPPKQSQKRDTEPSREPSLDKANASSNKRAPVLPKPDSVEQNIWNDFLELRKAKRAPLSNTALAAIDREAARAGWSLNDALAECLARGWQGFKADWVKEKADANKQPDNMGRTERAAMQALRDLGLAPAEAGRSEGAGGALPPARSHADVGRQSGAVLAIGHERSGQGGVVESRPNDDW